MATPIGVNRKRLVSQTVPQFRNRRPLNDKHYHQCSCHKQEREGKNGIYTPNNLIYRQHSCNEIICKDDDNPHCGGTGNAVENLSRTIYKHCSHHYKKHYGEHKHHLARGGAKSVADNLWKSRSTLAYGNHTAEIVMGGSGKDAAQNNPQISCRAKLCSHNGTKDRTCACNVQKLNHEYLPVGEHHEVNTVCLDNGRSISVVRPKHRFDKLSIKEIAQHKGYNA